MTIPPTRRRLFGLLAVAPVVRFGAMSAPVATQLARSFRAAVGKARELSLQVRLLEDAQRLAISRGRTW